jgi:hypothetical protein
MIFIILQLLENQKYILQLILVLTSIKQQDYKTVKRRLLEASGSISIDGTGVSTDHIGASFLN